VRRKFKQDVFLGNASRTAEPDYCSVAILPPAFRLLTSFNMIQLPLMLKSWVLQQPTRQTGREVSRFLTVHLGLDESAFSQKSPNQL